MEEVITVVKGTELKLLFTATQGENNEVVDLSNSRYKIIYYTGDKDKGLICTNSGANNLNHKIYDNNNELLIRLPTKDLAVGIIKCEATLYIKDPDFANEDGDLDDLEEPTDNSGVSDYDGYRKEIIRKTTNIKLID